MSTRFNNDIEDALAALGLNAKQDKEIREAISLYQNRIKTPQQRITELEAALREIKDEIPASPKLAMSKRILEIINEVL